MKQLAYVVFCLVAASCGSLPVIGEVITAWNSAALDAIRNESTSPPLAARNLAIIHAAIFDAVNAIDRSYEPYLFRPDPPAGASSGAAAIGAAYESLVSLYPSQQALFDQLLARTLNTIPPGQGRDDGFELGQLVGLLTLAWRSSDGASTTVPYIPGTDPGDWRRTPPFFRPPELPHWPYVVPFTMTNGPQFRPIGPPALTSTQYTRDFNLTKDLGQLNSSNRTAEQTVIARFWSDFSFTVTPPGHWNQIAQNVATNRASTLEQNARLFALLNLAMADAGIISWDAKYAYNFWRPVTAIREADSDGNPDTEADLDWTPLLSTPPFPEYTSGHSTFSAAAASILAEFRGTDHLPFSVGSDALPGVVRSYTSFAAAAEEIGLSRIYGGIHFLSADLDGLETGRRLGAYVLENFLRPVPERALLAISPGSPNGHVRLSLTGSTDHRYVVETSTNLLSWTPALTNAAPFTFDEPARELRFYRAVTAD